MSNGAPPAKPDLEAAAEWLVTIRSGEASDGDMAAFQSWLQSSPSNIAACRSVEQTFLRMPGLGGSGGGPVRDVLLKPSGRRAFMRQTFGIALVGGAIAAFYGGRTYRPGGLGADVATPTGVRHSLAMATGGSIHLDAQSAIDRAGDTIMLCAGAVAIDPPRDGWAIIAHGGTQMTVKGARRAFAAVDGEGGAIFGAIGADAIVAQGARRTSIAEGRQIAVAATDDMLSTRRGYGGETAWIDGYVEAHDDLLGTVVAQLRRYATDIIVVTDAARDLRLSGRFSLDRIGETLDALAGALPIRRRRIPGVFTLIDAA